MELLLGRTRPPSGSPRPVVHAGVPVTRGQLSIGRSLVGSPPCSVVVVTGLRSVSWIGPPDVKPLDVGRPCHQVTAQVDARWRVRLDRPARAYLGLADPDRFDAVLISLPDGGLLIAPLDDLDARLARVRLP